MAEERRLVTILFADLVGSTALAEELDPEDVRALMSRYYEIARDVVGTHGGIVAKLLGDGVLAAFGIPLAHDDDAKRALDAALALRDRITADASLARIQLRIGANTGEVVVSGTAGELIGDPVNVAARVAAAAEPGEVLAAESTHRGAPSIAFGERREIAAKGKSQPVRVWPVLGHTGRVAPETPFLGRERELASLGAVADEVLATGSARLIAVTAPAGTGKSRLVSEAIARFAARHPSARIAHAQCVPYGSMLTYGPLRPALCALLELPEDAPPGAIREAIGARALGPRIAELVALAVSPESGEDRERSEIFEAWCALFGSLAGERPVVLVASDLHWASDSLLDLVDRLACATGPVLLLCPGRPELLERRPAWTADAIALGPLDDGDVVTLVGHLLEANPPEQIRRLVVERAAGNPFFAGELIRTLLDRGPLDLRDGAAVERALAALPETVQATITARIDMLAPDERAVLQAGAVMGRTFEEDTIGVVASLGNDDLSLACAGLARKDLIVLAGERRWEFRHILIRDVAYQMLPRARRTRDHGVIARRLQLRAGERIEELAGIIGFHYLEATRLRRQSTLGTTGDEAEEDRRSAIIWLARAARNDAATGSRREAAAQLRGAIAVASPDEEILLQEQLALVHWGTLLADDAYQRAMALARGGAGDLATRSRVTSQYVTFMERLAVTVSEDRRPDEAVRDRLAADALRLAEESGSELALALALALRAYRTLHHGDPTAGIERARADAERAVEILARLGEPERLSVALDALGAAMAASGDIVGALEVVRRRVPLVDRMGDLFEKGHALWTVPLYALPLGEIREGAAAIARGLTMNLGAMAQQTSYGVDVSGDANLIYMWGWQDLASTMLGEWDAVVARVPRMVGSLAELRGTVFESLLVDGLVNALYVARRRGEAAAMEALLALLEGVPHEPGYATAVIDDAPITAEPWLAGLERGGTSTWGAERHFALLAAQRAVLPRARLDELVADAERRGLRPIHAHLLRLRAVAGGALSDLEQAIAELDALGMSPDAALARVELGACASDASALDAAERELGRIGDRRGLARLTEVRAKPPSP